MGLKEAVARLGRPEAAREMGLERLPPCMLTAKVKIAEFPEEIVWVAKPVLARVKSAVEPVPMEMRCGPDELAVKLASPV